MSEKIKEFIRDRSVLPLPTFGGDGAVQKLAHPLTNRLVDKGHKEFTRMALGRPALLRTLCGRLEEMEQVSEGRGATDSGGTLPDDAEAWPPLPAGPEKAPSVSGTSEKSGEVAWPPPSGGNAAASAEILSLLQKPPTPGPACVLDAPPSDPWDRHRVRDSSARIKRQKSFQVHMSGQSRPLRNVLIPEEASVSPVIKAMRTHLGLFVDGDPSSVRIRDSRGEIIAPSYREIQEGSRYSFCTPLPNATEGKDRPTLRDGSLPKGKPFGKGTGGKQGGPSGGKTVMKGEAHKGAGGKKGSAGGASTTGSAAPKEKHGGNKRTPKDPPARPEGKGKANWGDFPTLPSKGEVVHPSWEDEGYEEEVVDEWQEGGWSQASGRRRKTKGNAWPPGTH